ncbi:MAG: TonB-dependent receptor plug domain-containing protein [Pseudomonadota bacterium]
MYYTTNRALLRATTTLFVGLSFTSPVLAQSETPVDLGELVLGESRRDIQTDTAATETVIDQEELDERQGSTVAELVTTVPGVTLVNGSSPAGSAINIRGLGAQSGVFGTDNKVDIVVDGVAKGSDEIYRFGTQLISEPELYKQVTVIRGPGGITAFGNGAIGGTVQLETKNASDFTGGEIGTYFRQKFGYESNGDGLLSSTIFAWQPTDNFEFIGSYVRRDTNDFEDGAGNNARDSGFTSDNLLIKGRYQFGPGSAHSITASYQFTEIPERNVDYNAFNPGSFATLVNRDSRNVTGIVAYEFNPADNELINFKAQLSVSDEKVRFTSAAPASANSELGNTDHATKRTVLSFTNEARFNTGAVNHTLLTGLDIGRESRSALDRRNPPPNGPGENAVAAPGGDKDFIAVYVANEMQFGALTVTPALRYERQTITSRNNNGTVGSFRPVPPGPLDGTEFSADGWSGGISGRYQFNDSVAVFGTVAYSEGLPIFDDLRTAIAGVPTSPDALINRVEKAASVELGFNIDKQNVFSDGDQFAAEIVAFKNRLWDVTTYRGIREVEIKGVEIELSYAHTSGWYTDFNAAVIRGDDMTNRNRFEQTPADQIRLTVGKRMLDDQLNLNAEAVHYRANTRTDSTSPFSVGTLPTESATIFNIGASYRPNTGNWKGVEVIFGIDNVTDRAYAPYLSTRNIPGRNVKLSIAKSF